MKKHLEQYKTKEQLRLYQGYKSELKECYAKMMNSSKENKEFCVYSVSLEKELLTDWNYMKAINFIVDRLTEEGIVVRVQQPNMLLINWKKYQIVDEKEDEEKKNYLKKIKETEEYKKKIGYDC